eukprot:gene7147-biopygen14022
MKVLLKTVLMWRRWCPSDRSTDSWCFLRRARLWWTTRKTVISILLYMSPDDEGMVDDPAPTNILECRC